MASEGTESETAADDGAAAVDHQGGQEGLESDWKVPPAPAAAGVSQSDESLEEKRKLMLETQRRMEETQRNLAAQMASLKADEARLEQEQMMECERREAEKARTEEEKKMAKERREMAEIESYPTPRMVVRDACQYYTVTGPLMSGLRVGHSTSVVAHEEFTLQTKVSKFIRMGFEPLGPPFDTGIIQKHTSEFYVSGVVKTTDYVERHVFGQALVKYGAPRHETPYVWESRQTTQDLLLTEYLAQDKAAKEGRKQADEAFMKWKKAREKQEETP